jgi:hypothetical protein
VTFDVGAYTRTVAPVHAPIQQAVIANLVGVDFVAVHLTWGAINEWSTHAGYTRLAARADHPVLTDLLDRIMRQETRFALRHFWAPVTRAVTPRSRRSG